MLCFLNANDLQYSLVALWTSTWTMMSCKQLMISICHHFAQMNNFHHLTKSGIQKLKMYQQSVVATIKLALLMISVDSTNLKSGAGHRRRHHKISHSLPFSSFHEGEIS